MACVGEMRFPTVCLDTIYSSYDGWQRGIVATIQDSIIHVSAEVANPTIGGTMEVVGTALILLMALNRYLGTAKRKPLTVRLFLHVVERESKAISY